MLYLQHVNVRITSNHFTHPDASHPAVLLPARLTSCLDCSQLDQPAHLEQRERQWQALEQVAEQHRHTMGNSTAGHSGGPADKASVGSPGSLRVNAS